MGVLQWSFPADDFLLTANQTVVCIWLTDQWPAHDQSGAEGFGFAAAQNTEKEIKWFALPPTLNLNPA